MTKARLVERAKAATVPRSKALAPWVLLLLLLSMLMKKGRDEVSVACPVLCHDDGREERESGVSTKACPSLKAALAPRQDGGATALSLRDSVITQKACRSGATAPQVQGGASRKLLMTPTRSNPSNDEALPNGPRGNRHPCLDLLLGGSRVSVKGG